MYKTEDITNKLLKGDCLEMLPKIESKSIDLILTDPPYLKTALKFDKKSLDFDFVFNEFSRIIKDNGRFFLFGTLDMYCVARKYFTFQFDYVWVKNCICPKHNASTKPYYKHEHLFSFMSNNCKKVSNLTFNPLDLRTAGKPYTCKKNIVHNDYNISEFKKANRSFMTHRAYETNNTGYREGTTILEFNRPTKKKDTEKHPTAKPIDLLKHIIKGYSNENDLVLDPFAGGGSTLIAAVQTNRNYIGIEMDDTYYNLSTTGLKNANKDNLLFD